MKSLKIAISIVLLSAILFSCNTPRKEVAATQEKVDPNGALKGHFPGALSLPFIVDTTLLFHLEKADSLGTTEIRELDRNWFQHAITEISGTAYDLKQFYKIDSIKASGHYNMWADSLQPGDTKISNAYALARIEADSNTTLLVWALVTMSYEACPYSSSRAVYFTIVHKGIIGQTFLLGEHISAGDPPVSLERTVNGKLNKDLTFELNVYEEGAEDMDAPKINITREHYEFSIKDGSVSLVKEIKEPAVKVRRKK